MRVQESSLGPAASQRVRAAAHELCAAVEARMDELIELIEHETTLVREGKVFALKALEPRKAKAAKEFITGLEAVKKIRPSLEIHAPDAMYRLRRHHAEFRAMLQLCLAALSTAKQASDDIISNISAGQALNRQGVSAYADFG